MNQYIYNYFYNMVRLILTLFLSVLILIVPQAVLAQKVTTSPSPSVMPSPVVMNSNELFWPLAAGKTIDDPLYFLKTFKENLRGWLIFGNAQKAEYAVFLGTKRVLEAEKLLKEDKKEVANRTFDKALEQFEIAQKNVEEASNKKMLSKGSVDTMKPRLNNLVNFLPTLDFDKANEVLQKVKELNSKI